MVSSLILGCGGPVDRAGPTNPPAASPPSVNPLQSPVDRKAAELMASSPRLNSLVIAVAKGTAHYVGGYGELESGKKPDGDTVYRVASVTKPLTGLLVASYAAEGKISYDEAVVDCSAQKLAALCSDQRATTWLDLLSHYSGLPGQPDRPDFEPGEYLKSRKPTTAPGEKFEYSTVGYAVLGWALEQRVGKAYDQLLKERVLAPLAMNSTGFELTPSMEARRARGHKDGKTLSDTPRPRVIWPSGAIFSSANDLLRLLTQNQTAGTTLAAAIAHTQETLPKRRTFAPSIAAKGWQYFAPLKLYWHSGTAKGYGAVVAFSKERGTSVVLLTNTGVGGPDTRLIMAAFALLAEL